MGKALANPTAMILSAAMMLDWLGVRHDHAPATEAALRIGRAVDRAYGTGLKPFEFGGHDGTSAIATAVMQALDAHAS
jgi:3-isopropylmalate dehydrogenase